MTKYVYDNEDIIAEYDGSNALLATYLHGPGIDEPVYMERGGQKYYYHSDGLGSITELTNSSGTVVQTYKYDAFGNIVAQTGSLTNPFTYTAREFDSESGLYFYRRRYYDPHIGRFLSEDPIGFASGDINLYTYTFNNPINFTDPTGEAVPLILVIIGAGGLINGGLEAGATLSSGGSFNNAVGAFGRGFVSGAVGTTVGLGVGFLTKNPALTGSAGAVSANLTDKLISSGGNVKCLDAQSAAQSAALGGVLGPFVKNIPGLKTQGRLPDLFRPRGADEFGKNSLRLIGQRIVRSLLGKTLNSLLE